MTQHSYFFSERELTELKLPLGPFDLQKYLEPLEKMLATPPPVQVLLPHKMRGIPKTSFLHKYQLIYDKTSKYVKTLSIEGKICPKALLDAAMLADKL